MRSFLCRSRISQADRQVALAKVPRRIMLGDGLLFTALSLIDPDIDQRIVLMDSFMKR